MKAEPKKAKSSKRVYENDGETLPEQEIKIFKNKTNRIIAIVYLSLLALTTAIIPASIQSLNPHSSGVWISFSLIAYWGIFLPLALILLLTLYL